MTSGLLVSRLHKIELRKISIKTPTLENIENYKKIHKSLKCYPKEK
jgi:hypothetical protein